MDLTRLPDTRQFGMHPPKNLTMNQQKNNINFATPNNEATVKLYTDVSKKCLGIEPKHFYPTTSLGFTLPDVEKFDTVYFTLPTMITFPQAILYVSVIKWFDKKRS